MGYVSAFQLVLMKPPNFFPFTLTHLPILHIYTFLLNIHTFLLYTWQQGWQQSSQVLKFFKGCPPTSPNPHHNCLASSQRDSSCPHASFSCEFRHTKPRTNLDIIGQRHRSCLLFVVRGKVKHERIQTSSTGAFVDFESPTSKSKV